MMIVLDIITYCLKETVCISHCEEATLSLKVGHEYLDIGPEYSNL